jgi:uncharacterized protein YbjT (DUF2867 family)
MKTDAHKPTLVLGARGKIGRRVVERLRARGVPVREGSRRGEPPFDWEDPATWAPVLRGTTAAYLSYYPDVAVPGAAAAIGDFAQVALDQGVPRLVLLSGRGEEEAQRAEQALQDAGADWTIVRCSWFSQNFSENFFLDGVLAGELALPVDGIPEPFVDGEDIADVATAALIEDGHVGRLYELTGPRLLTFAEAIDEIAAASRRPVRFVPVSVEQFAAALGEQEVPADLVSLLSYLFSEVLDGRNAKLADGVQHALGREPADFGDYARRTAAAGVWAG